MSFPLDGNKFYTNDRVYILNNGTKLFGIIINIESYTNLENLLCWRYQICFNNPNNNIISESTWFMEERIFRINNPIEDLDNYKDFLSFYAENDFLEFEKKDEDEFFSTP